MFLSVAQIVQKLPGTLYPSTIFAAIIVPPIAANENPAAAKRNKITARSSPIILFAYRYTQRFLICLQAVSIAGYATSFYSPYLAGLICMRLQRLEEKNTYQKGFAVFVMALLTLRCPTVRRLFFYFFIYGGYAFL